MTYTLKPDAQGHLAIDNKSGFYKPGDTLHITGNPKSILVSNLIGAPNDRINITNVPSEKLTIGNPAWAGSGNSYAIMFKRCKHINLFGSSKESFVITGSTVPNIDRGAYFNMRIDDLSDNFSVHDISVRDGGNAIWAKTEVSKTDSATWNPAVLENFEFYNLDIRNTYTEGLYIGHTATWWDISAAGMGQPFYSTPPAGTTQYKQPVKLKNVVIRNCYLENCGYDGIQTAAVDGLQVYDNEVVGWGARKDSGHSGGILIGGRVSNFKVYNNHVHDGWGQMLQVLAEGQGVITNNLLVNTAFGEGIYLRGTTGLSTSITRNTVIGTASQPVRVNGSLGSKTKQLLQDNILAGPKTWLSYFGDRNFVYTENEGVFEEANNLKFKSLADAKLDANKSYQPLDGSTAAGYTKPVIEPPLPDLVSKITITSNELAALLKALKPGTYSFEVGVDSVVKKVSLKVE